MNKIVEALRELLTALEYQSLLCIQASKAMGKARAALAEHDAQLAAQPVMSMKKAERDSLSKPAMDTLSTAMGGQNAIYRKGQKSIGRDDPRHPLYQGAQPAEQPLTFEQAWAAYEAKGFRYGNDALEQVRFGWRIAQEFAEGAQPASQPSTGWVAKKETYAFPVLFNPYTGEPRNARDIQSDPQGVLIAVPGAEMLAAQPAVQQERTERERFDAWWATRQGVDDEWDGAIGWMAWQAALAQRNP